MIPFAVVTGLLTITLIAGLMIAMPAFVRPTLPLGVAVPTAHVGDPAIAIALRRFRWSIAVTWAVGVALTLVLAALDVALALILPTLVVVAGVTLGYSLNRGTILAAKRRGEWYRDVPVRLRGAVTPLAPPHAAYGWFVAALVVLAATAAVGVAVYPTLPDPMPVHWGADGEVNRWAARSIGSVFSQLLAGLGIAIVLFLMTFLVRFAPARVDASGVKAEVQRHYVGGLLGQLALILALLLAWLSLVAWFLPGGGGAMLVGVVVMLALLAVSIVVFLLRVRHAATAQRAAGAASPGATGVEHPASTAEHPDDDSHWKAGLFYVNSEDPAVLVPKRFGIGWTINLGSPGGKAIGVILLLVIVASVALPFILPQQG